MVSLTISILLLLSFDMYFKSGPVHTKTNCSFCFMVSLFSF